MSDLLLLIAVQPFLAWAIALAVGEMAAVRDSVLAMLAAAGGRGDASDGQRGCTSQIDVGHLGWVLNFRN